MCQQERRTTRKFCLHILSLAKLGIWEAVHVNLILKTSYNTEKVSKLGRIWFEARIPFGNFRGGDGPSTLFICKHELCEVKFE